MGDLSHSVSPTLWEGAGPVLAEYYCLFVVM